MKAVGAKKQTVFLTGVNAVVRALGLLMRVMLSRLLGAEIMGIAELAQGVHMLAITPAHIRAAPGHQPHDRACAKGRKAKAAAGRRVFG